MSLFPAYSGWNDRNRSFNEDTQWLTNNSFRVEVPNVRNEKRRNKRAAKAEKNAPGQGKISKKSQKRINWYKKKVELRKERSKCKKFRKKNPIVPLISDQCDLYCIDKTQRMDYLICSTLTRPIKPRYRVYKKNLIGPQYQETKKEKNRRYFMLKFGIKTREEKEQKAENDLRVFKISEEFNRTLCKNSRVSEWIAFVEFQDEFFLSQKITYKTESERERAIKKRKLDILERAMNFNPESVELLRYWMKIGTEILSPDEVSASLQKMINLSPGRLSLWISLISVRQQSLALCTFSSVTALYKNAINCMKNIKTDDIARRDSDVLELLFHYCKFLQDSGHWEILWTIFKNNVKLNFGLDLNIDVDIADLRIRQLEDQIICVEKQPIWVTWKKVEALREGLHFLPVAEAAYYPQRCVFLNDLFDFILHFHRSIHFKFIIKFLTLLKVPLLPFNTAVSEALYKTGSISTLDSPELILSTAFSSPASGVKIDYLKYVAQVSTGPQYLKNVEGQQEFLEVIQRTFQECMRILDGKEKLFLGLWWLRFNRWLCILDKHSLASLQLPEKKIKNFFKDFMKNPENRDNLLYYCEYGLFEYNQGNIEASMKTLKTLISSRQSVHRLTDETEKAALCQVYRYLCELYLEIGRKEDAVKILINLAVGSSFSARIDTLESAFNKYENSIFDLVREMLLVPDSLERILLPQFSLEWIHCYLWLLALCDPADARSLYLRLDSQLSGNKNMFSGYAREYLCEATGAILWRLEKSNPSPLMHIITDGLAQFPYNLKLLSLLASKKLNEHGLWWTFKKSFLNPPTIFGCVILICVALARKEIEEENFGNRLKSLFRQLALDDGKLCSVVHRLRLIFLFDFDHSQLDNAQVNAVESCPWNKSVYTSAVSVLPNKLMELTDIMIEKELRVHVTPDEIQEMRD